MNNNLLILHQNIEKAVHETNNKIKNENDDHNKNKNNIDNENKDDIFEILKKMNLNIEIGMNNKENQINQMKIILRKYDYFQVI